MPRFRKTNRSTRIRAPPRVSLEMREPHEIVGSNEWVAVRNQRAFLEGRAISTGSSGITRNDMAKNTTIKQVEQGSNSMLVDNILNFIDETEWAQIEGGEHNNRWINPKHYPNRIFETGLIKETGTEEIHYFPLSSTEEDPKGLAMRYQMIGGAGQYCTVVPNTWRKYISPATIKREKRHRKKNHSRRLANAEMEQAENEL